MAEYKGIKGFKVQSLASDPTADEGQIWYNTTSSTLKYDTVAAGTWASGGALGTGRYGAGGAGSQTAALIFGGSGPVTAVTESYDGSTWTEVADLVQARTYLGGCGTQTAALAYGGGDHTSGVLTENWNGSAWTEVGDLITARRRFGSCGITTAALAMAGGPPFLALVEDYNGTAWTEVGDLNTARQKPFAAKNGTPTAALCYGGGPPGTPGAQAIAITESYNGTTWTEVADLGSARYGGRWSWNSNRCFMYWRSGPRILSTNTIEIRIF